jgi:hypothetical protein
VPTSVAFALTEQSFQAKLLVLRSKNPTLHKSLILSLADAVDMDWRVFELAYHWHSHSAHFSEPIVWGDFSPLDLPVKIYAALDEASGLITPLVFWEPAYLR